MVCDSQDRRHCDFLFTFFLGCLTLGEIAATPQGPESKLVEWSMRQVIEEPCQRSERGFCQQLCKSWPSDDSSHESAISEQDS